MLLLCLCCFFEFLPLFSLFSFLACFPFFSQSFSRTRIGYFKIQNEGDTGISTLPPLNFRVVTLFLIQNKIKARLPLLLLLLYLPPPWLRHPDKTTGNTNTARISQSSCLTIPPSFSSPSSSLPSSPHPTTHGHNPLVVALVLGKGLGIGLGCLGHHRYGGGRGRHHGEGAGAVPLVRRLVRELLHLVEFYEYCVG